MHGGSTSRHQSLCSARGRVMCVNIVPSANDKLLGFVVLGSGEDLVAVKVPAALSDHAFMG